MYCKQDRIVEIEEQEQDRNIFSNTYFVDLRKKSLYLLLTIII